MIEKIGVTVIIILMTCTSCQYEMSLSNIETIEDAIEWTAYNIEYRQDDGEYWQTPQETLELKCGDCEDFSILALFLIYEYVDIEGQMIAGSLNGMGHYWVFVNDQQWEPQTASIVNSDSYKISKLIDYDEIMKRLE